MKNDSNNWIQITIGINKYQLQKSIPGLNKIINQLNGIETNQSNEVEEELLTTEELAILFKNTPGTIRKWVKDGKLPYVRVRRNIMFRKSEILKLHEKRRKQKIK